MGGAQAPGTSGHVSDEKLRLLLREIPLPVERLCVEFERLDRKRDAPLECQLLWLKERFRRDGLTPGICVSYVGPEATPSRVRPARPARGSWYASVQRWTPGTTTRSFRYEQPEFEKRVPWSAFGETMTAALADLFRQIHTPMVCSGTHHGDGTEGCPRKLHHHHDGRGDCVVTTGGIRIVRPPTDQERWRLP